MKRIVIIGRGGQGGKSAGAILAEAALEMGHYIQAFAEYGAERQGAPVYSFVRIDDKEIRLHTSIVNPDIVAVIDPTLITALPITESIGDDGILVLNTVHTPQEIREKLNFHKGKVFTVDATHISIDCFGVNIPNTPMLGAIEKAAKLVTIEELKKKMKDKFLRKLGQEIVDKNIKALERAYKEVVEG